MNPEQQERERQEALIARRCKLIEQGKLKPGAPLPGDKPASVKRPPSDICPSCGDKMRWIEVRKAFICIRVGCQTPK